MKDKEVDLFLRIGAAFEKLKLEHQARMRRIKMLDWAMPLGVVCGFCLLIGGIVVEGWREDSVAYHKSKRGRCLTDGQIAEYLRTGEIDADTRTEN